VKKLGQWMPAGLLLILALVMLGSEIIARPEKVWVVAVSTAVTVIVHLALGRHALLSIFVGTATYIVLLNFF
jgi:branched-subunit amino acid transport protein AzlD